MSDLVQYLTGTPGRPRVTFASGGTATDLDALPTVTLTRPDGTAGPAAGAVSHPAVGTYEIAVDGPADPYWYDIRWSGAITSKAVARTTRAEWIGGFLFDTSDLRTMKVAGGTPFASEASYPNELIHETRTEVLEEFSSILGFSPVPRFVREVKSVGYGDQVKLRERHVQRILSVSVAGVAQTASNYMVVDGELLLPVTAYTATGWTSWGWGNVAVEYVAGWERIKGDGRDVALLRAAMKLDPGISSSTSTMSTLDGSVYSFDPAGQVTRAGHVRHFGVPAIDAWLNRNSLAGVAVA